MSALAAMTERSKRPARLAPSPMPLRPMSGEVSTAVKRCQGGSGSYFQKRQTVCMLGHVFHIANRK